MPKADEVAAQFMSSGRTGSSDSSVNAEYSYCYPQNETSALGYDTQGRTKMVSAEVDYNMVPDRKNPRSISDQATERDAEGKK